MLWKTMPIFDVRIVANKSSFQCARESAARYEFKIIYELIAKEALIHT